MVMAKFHITRDGAVALCMATERPCPLGGQHFPSMEAAALALMERDTTPPPADTVPMGRYKGRSYSDLTADRAYCAWLLRQAWFKHDYPDTYRRVRRVRDVNRLRDDFNNL